jgi:hypothetical protein
MSLASPHTFSPGELLTAANLQNIETNILNNPISLVSPTTGAINFNLQAHTNLPASAITATSGTGGQALIASSSGGTVFGAAAGQAGSRVKGLAGTLTTQTGIFTASQYVLQTTPGTASFVLNSTDSFTVNLGTAGPAVNGRDIAGVFASTYVHWYAITTGLGSTVAAGTVSTAAPPTGPVLPTGYSAWAYLGGSVYSSNSTTVAAPHFFRGNRAYYNVGSAILTNGASTAITTVGLTGTIPTNSLSAGIHTEVRSTDAATNNTVSLYFTSSAVYFTINSPAITGGIISANAEAADFPNVGSPNQVFYNLSTAVPLVNMSVLNYTMPNGGD